MKNPIVILAFALLSIFTHAHEGAELGPNGGRILEFSKDETMHGEVVAKDGHFHITLLDKEMKPVTISQQTLSAIKGDRENPEKLTVEVKDNHFKVPMLKGDEYLIIFQYQDSPKTKKISARLLYNANICEECKAQEWLCKCKPDADNK